ncbi:lysis system i-spanin subunit Rz [Chromobacterium piscinae]|uniref:lysis system i-spanin subunit Rz n=1 Tax=Chromobacterium piscinae TaxID=686831 RepID=UPI003F7EB477
MMMSWKGIVLAAALAALAFLGWEMRAVIAQRDAAVARASQAQQLAAATQAVRVREHQAAADDAATAAAYEKDLEDGKLELQAALARHASALRLRQQQPAAGRGDLPAITAGAGRRDGDAPADFSAAHGDDALRLAAEADDVVRQLSACQAIVGSDRAAQ